ncbi:MAG: hypothetical protein JXX28_06085 [Deltaproteobacteria bacterium]|nr:hypothetical protein [Deltaproteobacteria bacterium]
MTSRLLLLLSGLLLAAPALAGPLDLGDERSDSEDETDLGDAPDLSRGATKAKAKAEAEGGTSVLDAFDFEEPVEEFEMFEGLPEDDLPDVSDPLESFDLTGPQRAPAGPVPLTLEVAGKTPFADNYPLTVVAVDRDAVVVEIPVMVARSRVEVAEGFAVKAVFYIGETAITQVEQRVEAQAAAEFGPTFVFLKAMVPVVERQGEVRVEVSKAPLSGAPPAPLFSQKASYSLL